MRHAGPTYGLEVQGAIKETISELSSNRSSVIEDRLFGFILNFNSHKPISLEHVDYPMHARLQQWKKDISYAKKLNSSMLH